MSEGEAPGSRGSTVDPRILSPSAGDPQRPATPARILLFLAALFGYALALSVAFPPGAPDRLPVLVLSVGLALAAAQRWGRGASLFALLFPCAGLIARLSGGSDPAAWPTLLFAGFATGWTFRFIYDFETRPDPSGPDSAVRALLALWTTATLYAVVEARNLWALLHGLSGRVVNGGGLSDTTAIRESLLSFGALASGAAFFLLMRRSGAAIRRQTLVAALTGTGIAAAAAILQRFDLLPAERNSFWKMTGRLSGGASDPNSLGMVAALALVLAAPFLRGPGRRWPALLAAALFAAALILSGSRSGLLLILASLLLLPALRQRARTPRTLAVAAAAGAILLVALWLLGGSRGALGGRLIDTLDSSRPVAARVSARPILWRASWRLFRQHPIQGAGMGVFLWRLPDLLRAEGLRLKARDNPGSAYFQALAETGILGVALTLFFAVALARDAVRRVARGDASSEAGGVATAAALGALSFLICLGVGSHWLAPDTSLFFFLVASVGVLPASPGASAAGRLWLRAAVLAYAAAAFVAALSTARAEEAFRFGSRIGFNEPEIGPAGEFQWTRQHFGFWLSPRQRVRLALGNFSPIGRPVEITAREDGRLLYRRSLGIGEIVVLDLSGAGSRTAALRFDLSSSFVPRRLGVGGDARELGLQASFLDR